MRSRAQSGAAVHRRSLRDEPPRCDRVHRCVGRRAGASAAADHTRPSSVAVCGAGCDLPGRDSLRRRSRASSTSPEVPRRTTSSKGRAPASRSGISTTTATSISTSSTARPSIVCDAAIPLRPQRSSATKGTGLSRTSLCARGVANERWGQGVCVGDIDNDGFEDLYVTNFGKNRLYHNDRGQAFRDVADAANVAVDSWSTGCAFGDFDGDGWLDLFVAGYVSLDLNQLPPAPPTASAPLDAHGASLDWRQHRALRRARTLPAHRSARIARSA